MKISSLHLFAVFLALVPALVWIWIFNKQSRASKGAIVLTFGAGMLSTAIILLYQFFWDETVNLIFFNFEPLNYKENIAQIMNFESLKLMTQAASQGLGSALLGTVFIVLGVGAMEEYVKHWVVKIFDRSFFRSIDDVIMLSIVAALGFAFVENVLYFVYHWHYFDATKLAFFVFFRVTVVTMVHVLCSGIFGYFYGLAYFAGPVLQDEHRQGKKFFFTQTLHKILHLKRETIFRDEKITEGLIIAILLHALYDFVLQISLTFGDVWGWFGIASANKVGVHVVLMPLYLIGGYFYLVYLLNKKEDQKRFGKLQLREVYSNSLEANVEYTQEQLDELNKEREALSGKVSTFYRFINDEKKEILEMEKRKRELEAEIERRKEVLEQK